MYRAVADQFIAELTRCIGTCCRPECWFSWRVSILHSCSPRDSIYPLDRVYYSLLWHAALLLFRVRIFEHAACYAAFVTCSDPKFLRNLHGQRKSRLVCLAIHRFFNGWLENERSSLLIGVSFCGTLVTLKIGSCEKKNHAFACAGKMFQYLFLRVFK